MAAEPRRRRLLRRLWKPALWALFVLNVVLLPLLVGGGAGEAAEVPAWMARRWWLFLAGHSLAIAFALPNSIFCLAAGALFGLGRGALLATAGTFFGALLAFCTGRLLLAPWLRRRTRRFPAFGAFLDALGEADARTVFLTRLSPLFPFAAQNFGWSLSPVRFRSYALGSLFGIPLGAVFFAHLGAAGSAGAVLAASGFSWPEVLTLIGVAATFPLVRWLGRLADRALAETLPADPEHEA